MWITMVAGVGRGTGTPGLQTTSSIHPILGPSNQEQNAAFCKGLLDGDGQYDGFCPDGRISSGKLCGWRSKN